MVLAAVLQTLGWIVAAAAALAALFGLMILPHNLRVRRVRRDYALLPADVRRRVLQMISDYAAGKPSVTLLRIDPAVAYDADAMLTASRVGGLPYAEAGQCWPLDDEGEPAHFLIQVRLDEGSLGLVWRDRLVQVFYRESDQLIVRSQAAPSADLYVPLTPVGPISPGKTILPLPYPAERPDEGHEEGDEEQSLPIGETLLVKRIPELVETLKPYSTDAAGVVAQIVAPGIFGYSIADIVAYVGGTPTLIQNSHEAKCPQCSQAMRFLFFFGELVEEITLGDAGTCCVYGCDDHPDEFRAFVDSH